MPKPHQVTVRSTRQAKAVAAILPTLPGFRSAPEIHAALHGAGERIGLATVYRQLRFLAGQDSVDTIRGGNGETLYRQRRVSAPHYHLTCRACGVSVEVDASEVRRWAERVAAQAGFTSVADTVQLSGLCPLHPAGARKATLPALGADVDARPRIHSGDFPSHGLARQGMCRGAL